MPTVEVSLKDLCKLVGKKFDKAGLAEALLYVKGEIDAVEGDKVKVDIKETNRPDLWSAEGIARELRGRLGIEKGLPKFKVKKSTHKLHIEKSIVSSRPVIMAAVANNAKVTNDFLVQMINLQVKIANTFGRNRREAGAGFYDFDKMKMPMYYKGYKAKELKFVPLGFDKEMYLDEIVDAHEKGKEFGHLVKSYDRYPIVIDSAGVVAAMPPIINSEQAGKVTEETKNLFLEVTGFDEKKIMVATNVHAAALHDRGCIVEAVKIVRANGSSFYSPDFTPKKITVDFDYVRKIAGFELKNKEIVELLRRARYEVKKLKGNKAELLYPAYRADILHPIDVVEDVLIGFGYNKVKPEAIQLATVGGERKETLREDLTREACIGLGLQEVLTFTLTSIEKQQEKMNLTKQEFVEIANPMSMNWHILRKSIMPELLEFLGKNKRFEYPQRIFEVGRCVELAEKTETGVAEKWKLCVVLSDKNVGFTQIKSGLEAVCRNLGIDCSVRKASHPAFVGGRTAEVVARGKVVGVVGEINEKTRQNFGLEMPVAMFEIEIC